MTRAAAAAAMATPPLARAHGAGVEWHAAPSDALAVLLPLVLAGVLYAVGLLRVASRAGLQPRDAARSTAFGAALLLLALALVWPLDAWSGVSFAAHMSQHMVLLALAPPLLLAGRPGATTLRALPASWRRTAVVPLRWAIVRALDGAAHSLPAMALLHGALIWIWHAPRVFEAALHSEALHALEHATLLAAGFLFWRALVGARRDAAGLAIVWMLVTLIHTGLLAALLTLAPQPLYASYVERLGVASALADQQLAGLIMWVPMGTVYILSALRIAHQWMAHQPRGPAAS